MPKFLLQSRLIEFFNCINFNKIKKVWLKKFEKFAVLIWNYFKVKVDPSLTPLELLEKYKLSNNNKLYSTKLKEILRRKR